MAGMTTNLIQGPATVYRGAFGATEPADTTTALDAVPDSGAWTDVGFTKDGVNLTIEQEYEEMDVDQIVDVPESRLVKRRVTVELSLAEGTLDNLEFSLNGGTVSDATGYKTFEPADANSATQPNYSAVIIDGYGPDGERRRIILRKVLSVDNVEFAYKKDEQSVFKCTLATHYVSSSIASYKIQEREAA
jgi:hypothetical protein